MSQGAGQVPTVGPVSPTVFAGDINVALLALFTRNRGSSAPANVSAAPSLGEEWDDTSPGAAIVDERVYDGANWLNRGGKDETNHLWMPKVGGGTNTLDTSAGGAIDIGAVRHSYVQLINCSLSNAITGFGSNALLNAGESKFVEARAPGIITYNATSLKTPGSADLKFNTGDTWQLIYLGGGNWRIFNYTRFSGLGHATGDIFVRAQKDNGGAGSVVGAVRMNGKTLGDAASSATEFADATTANLWIFLYLNTPAGNGGVNSAGVVSGGRTAPGNTRAAAITDYAAHKTITLPDAAGCALTALDDLGNGAQSRVTGTTSAPDGVTLFGRGGAQTVALAQGNLPNVAFTVSGIAVSLSDTTGYTFGFSNQNVGIGAADTTVVKSVVNSGGGGTITPTKSGTVSVSVTSQGSAASGGSNNAVNKMPPFLLAGTAYLAL